MNEETRELITKYTYTIGALVELCKYGKKGDMEQTIENHVQEVNKLAGEQILDTSTLLGRNWRDPLSRSQPAAEALPPITH